MKIEKAIEILQREKTDITLSPDPDVPAALQLGIEALKRLQLVRLGHNFPGAKLPSETE